MNIPKKVKAMFHEFCERCPVCKVETRNTEFFANGTVYMEESILTCEHYELCARLKQEKVLD